MFVDPNISSTVIDPNQLAVITKYDFELRDKGGHFELTDPVVRKANRGKGGKHVAGNLDMCIHAAVSERQAHEKAVAAAPPAAPKSGKKAAVKAEPPPPAEDPQPEAEAEATNVVYLDTNGNPQREPDPPVSTSEEPEQEEQVLTETAGEEEEASPSNEIEVDEENIDNTGKRERKSRKEEKGPRKDNRYLRAAKIVVDNLDIDAETLAGLADMSEATAGHCLEAWKGVTAALLAKGWLKLPKAAKAGTGK